MKFEEFCDLPEVELLLKHEGGARITDNPKDPGGLTKWGISLRAYPKLGTAGIRALTREQALRIYYDDYFIKPGCWLLPRAMAYILFDACVNQGAGWAVKAMQTSIGFSGDDVDGIIGTATIKRVQERGLEGIREFAVTRMRRYAGNSTGYKNFGLGWTRRLFAVYSVAQAIYQDEED